MLQQLLKVSLRHDAPFWRSQIDACKQTARFGHKVRCGWEAYGMTPYEVCMHRGYFRHPILPRYNSEPVLRSVCTSAYSAPLCRRAASHAVSSCASGRPSKSPGGTLRSP